MIIRTCECFIYVCLSPNKLYIDIGRTIAIVFLDTYLVHHKLRGSQEIAILQCNHYSNTYPSSIFVRYQIVSRECVLEGSSLSNEIASYLCQDNSSACFPCPLTDSYHSSSLTSQRSRTIFANGYHHRFSTTRSDHN